MRSELAGKTFGRWKVVRLDGVRNKHTIWMCRCRCGSLKRVMATSLISGTSLSCGCLHAEITASRNLKHGDYGSPEYRSWRHMMRRCKETTNNRFYRYGARGIRICDRWMDFRNFLADMGKRPSRRHTIERLNNDGNYEPGNCVWADPLAQASNRSNNVVLHVRGKSKTMTQWAREAGMLPGTLWYRIRNGWTPEDALSSPVRRIVPMTV